MKTHLKKFGFIFLMICCLVNNVKALTFDWTGTGTCDGLLQLGGLCVGTRVNVNAWNNSDNWVVGGSVPTTYPGDPTRSGSNADIVRFGVTGFAIFTNQPILTLTASQNITVNSIIFGTLEYSASNPVLPGTTLTVTGGTLNVTDDISLNVFSGGGTMATQNNYIKGTGTIICGDDIIIGVGTANAARNYYLFSEVANLNVSGDVSVNLRSTLGNGSGFRLQQGNMLIAGQISFQNTGGVSAINSGYFTIDAKNSTNAKSTVTLTLSNPNPIAGLPITGVGGNLATVNFNGTSVSNSGTGGKITVIYTGLNPTVYTTAASSWFGTGGGGINTGISTYNRLIINSTGTATIGNFTAGTLQIDSAFTTSSATDFSKFTTTTTIGASGLTAGTWTNSTTVTGGAGITTVNGLLLNNSPGIINQSSGDIIVNGTATNSGALNLGSGITDINGSITTSGILKMAGGALNISLNYNNTGTFTPSTGIALFDGTSTQLLDDGSSAGTTFNKVNFSGASTKTINSGKFFVSNIGVLTMVGASSILAVGINGNLTLNSDATSTASVAAIPTGSSITGSVNVQRFFTGNNSLSYRGYRLVSSPVNISGTGNLSLSYLNTTGKGLLTGGPGGPASGFTVNNRNPTVYLYDETLPTNNTSFVSGKNVGIVFISNTTVSTLSGTTTTANVNIPVGNSYLVYFVGDNSSTNTAANRIPLNTIITAVGPINQGTVPFKWWKGGGTTLSYTSGTGSSLAGISQVGNPYPSTIDLTQVYTQNSGSISPIFWEMNEPGQTYIAYNAQTGTAANPRAGKYIVSGQGFLVAANGAGKTLTFNEAQKTAYPTAFTSTSTPALVMSTPKDIGKVLASETPTQAPVPALSGLHIQMRLDSITNTQCGIYFDNKWTDNFSIMEDAIDLDGASPKVYMSSFTKDNMRTSINQLSAYTSGKRIKLFVKATFSGLYHLDLADIQNIDTTKYRLYLIDHYAKDSLDIGTHKSYAFNLLTTDTTTFGSNRFELAINKIPVQPYSLASFTAQKASDGVLLTWRAYNEDNNILFDLEKLLDNNNNYSSLYAKQSNGVTIYKYTDQIPNTGNNTYRLKQTDIETNTSVYSNLVSIVYDKAATGTFSVYPNPTAQTINVNISSAKASSTSASYKLNIYDAAGTLMIQKTISGNSWSQNVAQFKPGVYMMELKVDNGTSLGKAKFVKN